MTRNQEIIRRFCDGDSVFVLSRSYPDLAQWDIEGILRAWPHGRNVADRIKTAVGEDQLAALGHEQAQPNSCILP